MHAGIPLVAGSTKKQRLVSLVHGIDRKENIAMALGLIKPNLQELRSKRKILIKVNLTAANRAVANTSPEAVEAVVEFIKREFPAEFPKMGITVGECSAGAFYAGLRTSDVFRKMGYAKLEEKYKNLKLERFENFTDTYERETETVVGKTKIRILKHLGDFDYAISVAMPKTHNFAILTMGIKNMMGFVRPEHMTLMHGLKAGEKTDAPKTLFDRLPKWFIPVARRTLPQFLINFFFRSYPNYTKSVKIIHRNLANVLSELLPDLVVIDGFEGMEGNGPVDGEVVKLGIAIASADALKADSLCARVMGFRPEEIGYLYYMEKAGLGDCSLQGLVGAKLESVARKFKPHGTYAIQAQWR